MSFKLQDRIQRIKGLPGKYKRLLLAMASHARNDGTNIIASKATLAAEMGVVRFTVNRNMDALLAAGLVAVAEAHQCRNEFCPKGPRHYTERGNHWTQAYSINLVALQNVTPLSRGVASHFVRESRHILCASRVTFCAAKQGLGNPAPLGPEKASALTNGASKQASEHLPPPATDFAAEDELLSVVHTGFREEDIPMLRAQAAEVWQRYGEDAYAFLAWNRTHKPPKLQIRSLAQWLCIDPTPAINDFIRHVLNEPDPACRHCLRMRALPYGRGASFGAEA